MLTRKNIGWALVGLIAVVLIGSVFGKLSGGSTETLEAGGLNGWATIIGLGELAALVLFLIPRTMRLGAFLLCGYFGGAIMFHMSHPDPEQQAFVVPAAFLLGVIAIAAVRDKELFGI